LEEVIGEFIGKKAFWRVVSDFGVDIFQEGSIGKDGLEWVIGLQF